MGGRVVPHPSSLLETDQLEVRAYSGDSARKVTVTIGRGSDELGTGFVPEKDQIF